MSATTIAQKKDITLEAIWKGEFRTERIEALHSMANGKQYSVLNRDRKNRISSIDLYDYKTSKKVKTILSSKDISTLNYFTDYHFSKDESKILLTTKQIPVYRHSRLGMYFVYDLNTKKLTQISDQLIQEPTFSPDGTKIAYVQNNNLYLKDLVNQQTTQITFDGETNKIINGITDWVYEEEFSFVRAFEWNAGSNAIAFLRFDETEVPEFSMDVFGINLYPTQQVFKYPKAGETNAKVSLHIYDLDRNQTAEVTVNKNYNDFYIPRIKWTNNPQLLSAQYVNRHQNELDLWLINAQSLDANLVLPEKDTAYIDVTDNLTFLNDDSFIWTSETNGYNHIYHYSKKGKLINQVTKGDWDVTAYYGYHAETNTVFYQSVENGSVYRDVYAISLNGKNKKRLSRKEGTNSANFSANFKYYINTYSSTTTPPIYTLNNVQTGQELRIIKDNSRLTSKLEDYRLSTKEISTLNINNNTLNMWMLKPMDFDPSKAYPLLMFQYSGPGSQMVSNKWNNSDDYWHQYLAQQGVIVVCVDGRGTGFKGAAFKKVTQKELGKYELEDQIGVAKHLGQLPYIDASRIGIWGWSYGGFMSSNALFKGNGLFKMAIAVAPVTSWRFYDTIYTERYMTTPDENPSGYDDNSPIHFAQQLEGDFLLIHGSSDDNVHLQNTMRLSEALIQANKPFEQFIYPDKNHSIYGGNTRLHLYNKMTTFVMQSLGGKTN